MWLNHWRTTIWQNISSQTWDVVVIGGGITGAGILREATRWGLKTLLVEQKDFAYGTSSRSSKLVHGGLRYLKEGQVGLTWASVQEREKLQQAAPGLVNPLGFLFAHMKGRKQRQEKVLLTAGLAAYDLLAGQWNHQYHNAQQTWLMAPHLDPNKLLGSFQYEDAQTDDARLVLRVLQEAAAAGGTALNYAQAEQLIRENEQVVGVVVRDRESNHTAEVRAQVVINATGAWADELRQQVGQPGRLRPLRGSHLVFPQWRFPLAQAISFTHPKDGRPVFAFPWESVTLLGTTDVDHPAGLAEEPAISGAEVAYLMEAVQTFFPGLRLMLEDVIASYAGVRPVINTGQSDPSKESRDHVVWQENGLLTVTGGKLTTFRLIALDALQQLEPLFPNKGKLAQNAPAVDTPEVSLPKTLGVEASQRLTGRYGLHAPAVVECAQAGELELIPTTNVYWAELRWAAKAEAVVHLEDLLLRRVRLGLLLPQGAAEWAEKIRHICQPELGWSDEKWEAEWQAYQTLWRNFYSLPGRETIPAWSVPQEVEPLQPLPPRRTTPRWAILGGMVVGLFFYLVWVMRNSKKVESRK